MKRYAYRVYVYICKLIYKKDNNNNTINKSSIPVTGPLYIYTHTQKKESQLYINVFIYKMSTINMVEDNAELHYGKGSSPNKNESKRYYET